MSSPTKGGGSASSAHRSDHSPPTIAAFSPSTSLHSPSATKQRSTILVHQKSPLLVATPPQVTRALAYSHPFIAPLNRLAGLISWTTPDPWESFLLLAAFWTCTLYGDFIIRWAGPLLGVAGLILGMYARRYSPLSSTGWGSDSIAGRNRSDSELLKHHKSLDEIVDTMKLFTSRCNILLDPFLRMTDFLSTQRTATSATTRPALTSMFIRILLVTPIWCFLTLPPFYIITTKRVILAVGTVSLTWHSRPARVCRIILWRSRLLRGICTTITGLSFPEPEGGKSENNLSPHLQMAKKKTAHEVAASLAARRNTETPGIRFTFSLYENQRRWLGIGWTSSMLAYERGSWTDEHLNATVPKERFDLPEVDGGHAKWRWVKGSEWHLERTEDEAVAIKAGNDTEDGSWIYYDNKVIPFAEYQAQCQLLTHVSVVERWTPRPRWLGTLHTPPQVVSRRRTDRSDSLDGGDAVGNTETR